MQKHIYRLIISFLITVSFANAKQDNSVLSSVEQRSNEILQNLSEKDFSYINTGDLEQTQNKKLYPIIFYLYSQSMKLIAIKRFAYTIKKLKTKFPNIKGYVVLNGFPKKSFWLRVREDVYNKDLKDSIVFKVHPFIYNYYKARQVPAFIYINCPKDFRFKKCDRENSYIARGDFSLEYFFSLLKDNNKNLGKYYDFLRDVK